MKRIIILFSVSESGEMKPVAWCKSTDEARSRASAHATETGGGTYHTEEIFPSENGDTTFEVFPAKTEKAGKR